MQNRVNFKIKEKKLFYEIKIMNTKPLMIFIMIKNLLILKIDRKNQKNRQIVLYIIIRYAFRSWLK